MNNSDYTNLRVENLTLGMILDDKLRNWLRDNNFKESFKESENTETSIKSFSNESTSLFFHVPLKGDSFLQGIFSMKKLLNVNVGDEIQEAEDKIIKQNYYKKSDMKAESGKGFRYFYQSDNDELILHYENNKVTVIQMQILNPFIYNPQNKDIPKETIEFQLGMILNEDLEQKLRDRGFMETLNDLGIYTFFNQSLTLEFYPLTSMTFILKTITLSSTNHTDSIYNIKMDDDFEKIKEKILSQNYKMESETSIENGDQYIYYEHENKKITIILKHDKVDMIIFDLKNFPAELPINIDNNEVTDIILRNINNKELLNDILEEDMLGMELSEELINDLSNHGFIEEDDNNVGIKEFFIDKLVRLTFLPTPNKSGSFTLSIITYACRGASISNSLGPALADYPEMKGINDDDDYKEAKWYSSEYQKILEKKNYNTIYNMYECSEYQYLGKLCACNYELDKAINLNYDNYYTDKIRSIQKVLLNCLIPFKYSNSKVKVICENSPIKYYLGMLLNKKLDEELRSSGFEFKEVPVIISEGRGLTSYQYHSSKLLLVFEELPIHNYKVKILKEIHILPENSTHSILGIKNGDNINEAKKKLINHEYIVKIFGGFTKGNISINPMYDEHERITSIKISLVIRGECELLYKGDLKTNLIKIPLIDLISKDVSFLCKEPLTGDRVYLEDYVFNGEEHIFFNKESIEYYRSDHMIDYSTKIGELLESALYNNGLKRFVIHDYPSEDGVLDLDNPKIIDRETVIANKNLIIIFNCIVDCLRHYKTKEECYEKLKNIDMYFIGNKVVLDSFDDNGKITECHKDEVFIVSDEDMKNNTVPLFLDKLNLRDSTEKAVIVYATYDSAMKYGAKIWKSLDEKNFICKLPLHEIKERYNGSIIIEPYTDWNIVF